ncbi:HEAT repeat domain-containing protein [Streptomyces hydrogenans]|uniref:HEAT repeat domain-containing protein n=1 Tax=Streptomyces hydrogenans TaxID=1873719 RepID=UPI00332177D6
MRDVLLGLAENPALPAGLFARLVASGDEEILFTLADRERLTPPQVRALLTAGNPSLTCLLVRSGLVPWPEIPQEHPGRLLDAVLGWVAPAAAWRKAATDPDPEARQEAAHALDAPADAIASLARDPDPAVVAAAGSPHLPPELLHDLARHPSTVVRQAVADNENAAPSLLAALLADGGWPAPTRCGACHRREAACADHTPGIRRVRLAAASHPAVPPEGLAADLDAPEAWTVTTFAARTDLPTDFLNRLATPPSCDVRAVSPRTPLPPNPCCVDSPQIPLLRSAEPSQRTRPSRSTCSPPSRCSRTAAWRTGTPRRVGHRA